MASRCPLLTFAVCSNRAHLLADVVQSIRACMADDDRILVVTDTAVVPGKEILRAFDQTGVRVIANGVNRGLAYSRNRVLKESETRHVVFVDDDIEITPAVVERVRHVMSTGHDVVGVRITAQLGGKAIPWYLTCGQLHYLGVHNPARPASIWGGCFAVDVERARLLGVEFDERLGRTGTTLASAEDTTFVRGMVARGARTAVLHDAEVMHRVADERLSLRYLVRRAYWQGRSELRRGAGWRGLGKEWRRYREAECPTPRRLLLAVMFGTCVAAGCLREAASPARWVRGHMRPAAPDGARLWLRRITRRAHMGLMGRSND